MPRAQQLADHSNTALITALAAGLPDHAPFDRIIATCAVPTVPWPWVTQTRTGGVILTDLKPAFGAGSLGRLTRHPDRAEGRCQLRPRHPHLAELLPSGHAWQLPLR